MAGFHITGNSGLHITFDNGYTVSIQIGPSTYSDNYDMSGPHPKDGYRSTTAETAVLTPSGELLELDAYPGDTVQPRMTPRDVLNLLAWVAKQEGNDE